MSNIVHNMGLEADEGLLHAPGRDDILHKQVDSPASRMSRAACSTAARSLSTSTRESSPRLGGEEMSRSTRNGGSMGVTGVVEALKRISGRRRARNPMSPES